MKTTVKQLATVSFVAFLFLVGNVKAEGTETTALNSEIIETPLQLEDWMTNELIWSPNAENMSEFTQETESAMELESWMFNDAIWNVSYTETEPELKLESWMTDDDLWR